MEIYVECDETEKDSDYEDVTPVSEEKLREDFPDFDSFPSFIQRNIRSTYLVTRKDTRKVIPEDNMFYAVNDYFLGDKVHNFMRLSDYLDSRMEEDEKKAPGMLPGE